MVAKHLGGLSRSDGPCVALQPPGTPQRSRKDGLSRDVQRFPLQLSAGALLSAVFFIPLLVFCLLVTLPCVPHSPGKRPFIDTQPPGTRLPA